MSDEVRISEWDGGPATTCGYPKCGKPVILHGELMGPDDWAAEVDFCAEHVGEIAAHARAFLIALGHLEPETAVERTVRAVGSEYLT